MEGKGANRGILGTSRDWKTTKGTAYKYCVLIIVNLLPMGPGVNNSEAMMREQRTEQLVDAPEDGRNQLPAIGEEGNRPVRG